MIFLICSAPRFRGSIVIIFLTAQRLFVERIGNAPQPEESNAHPMETADLPLRLFSPRDGLDSNNEAVFKISVGIGSSNCIGIFTDNSMMVLLSGMQPFSAILKVNSMAPPKHQRLALYAMLSNPSTFILIYSFNHTRWRSYQSPARECRHVQLGQASHRASGTSRQSPAGRRTAPTTHR